MTCDMHCVEVGGVYRCECSRCGSTLAVRRLPVHVTCGVYLHSSPREISCLAGTALKSLLATIGITSTPNCACNARAREMDVRGCDWCEQNINTIVGWLREEATKRNLPFIDAAGRLLVRRAIRNARRAAAN